MTNSLDITEIFKLIPHRYPFLLVDKITDYVPREYSKGYKNLTFNELFFQGHFPNNPVMPGVLQLEALAQTGAPILLTLPEYKDKLTLFAGIDNARFKKVVRPGDRLDMEVYVVKHKGFVTKTHGQAFVDGKLAVEADFTTVLQ